MNVEHKVQFTYPAPVRSRPLLYALSHDFDVVTNIQEARVTPEEAWLILLVSGEEAQVNQGLEWIAAQGVQVERLT
jgi:hypothetical protein